MSRALLRFTLVLLMIGMACLPTFAQTQTPTSSTTSERGIGISVTFPFSSLPAGSTSAMLLVNLLAQGNISPQLVNQLELRFFLDASGFQTGLTSARESLLVLFTGPPAIFYMGGGVGAFPIRVTGKEDGTLLSLLLRTGIEVQVAPLGLFLDFSYEAMPQPYADIQAAGYSPATINSLELSFGAIFHF